MDTKLKKSWITALKSGQYKQGTHCLCSNDRYCALGVLWDCTDNYWYRRDNYPTHGKGDAPVWATTQYGGIATIPRDILPVHVQVNVIFLNDTRKLTFTKIADIIDQDPSI